MAQDTPFNSDAPLNPDRWVEEHGDILLRYALARVRDTAVAEDLVQETFLSAWKARQGFAGLSAERSWLVGILKHKIMDYIRRTSRERGLFPEEPLPSVLADQFDEHFRRRLGKLHAIVPLRPIGEPLAQPSRGGGPAIDQ